MTKDEAKVGEVVQLNSGGPNSTITIVYENLDKETMCVVTGMDSLGRAYTNTLPASCLTKVTQKKDAPRGIFSWRD